MSDKTRNKSFDAFSYNGNFRFRVEGSFYGVPEISDEDAAAKGLKITRYSDGSATVETQLLVSDKTSYEDLEMEHDEILCEIEQKLGFQPGEGLELSSSAWYVGFIDSDKDYLMTEGEREIILKAEEAP